MKGEKPMKERANAHLEPVDFEKEFRAFQKQFSVAPNSELDFISYKLYPKVFEAYHQHVQEFGNVSVIPTISFFYGLKTDEEIIVEIDEGKTLLIQLIFVGDANEEGYRSVRFKLNGQSRTVKVKDRSIKVDTVVHKKVNPQVPNEIGSPLQGLLSKIFVKAGDKVEKNQPLFVIEAMKMETTVTASRATSVQQIELSEGVMLDADDLVVVLK